VVPAPEPVVLDPGDPGAVGDQAGHHREGLDAEVLAPHHRVEVRPGGAEPATAVHVAVEGGEALLAVAVDVVGERVAGLLHGLEERAEQRAGRGSALQHQRAAAAAPLVGAGQAGLHALEVRQAVRVVPGVHALVGGPALVVERVAALEDHAVDGARAAEHLAPCVVDLAAAHVRLGLRLVLPVVEPVADRVRQRRGHVDERVEPVVVAARLEHQHAGARVGGEAVRDRAAGRASPHHDEVVVPSGPRPAPAVRHAPTSRRTSAAARVARCARCAWSRGTRRARHGRARGRPRTACSRPTPPAGRTGGSR